MLGSIEGGLAYDDVLAESVEVRIGGRPVFLLGLAAIVRIKRGSGDAKDRLRLPVLEATLRRLGSSGPTD